MPAPDLLAAADAPVPDADALADALILATIDYSDAPRDDTAASLRSSKAALTAAIRSLAARAAQAERENAESTAALAEAVAVWEERVACANQICAHCRSPFDVASGAMSEHVASCECNPLVARIAELRRLGLEACNIADRLTCCEPATDDEQRVATIRTALTASPGARAGVERWPSAEWEGGSDHGWELYAGPLLLVVEEGIGEWHWQVVEDDDGNASRVGKAATAHEAKLAAEDAAIRLLDEARAKLGGAK